MTRMLFALFVVAAVFAAGSLGDNCGENEVFTACGTACEPTCAQPRIIVCTYQCKVGCLCADGYLRNFDGACVAPQYC